MSALLSSQAETPSHTRTFLELSFWSLHNSDENQTARLSAYLENGRFPALTRAGAKPIAALATLIGPDTPTILTLVQYPSLSAMQETLTQLDANDSHQKALESFSSGPGLPFVTVESTLLHSLAVLPEAVLPTDASTRSPRIFELRCYQSQSWPARQKKAAMFNSGEIGVFQRLGMLPVFIGESIIGPRQPNITYMLSYDSLAERERHWQAFSSDPEWKRLSAPPELKDSQIVANISNTIFRSLPFSPLR